jgi:multimeric flavodoxin WrbA
LITVLSDEKVSDIGRAIFDGLFRIHQDTKHFSLQNMNIQPCYACRGCEQKTYRRCVVRDDADLIMPYLARSEIIVPVTQITYGSYSFQMKRIIDKLALLVGMYYSYKDGELVHSSGPADVRFYAVGIHDCADAAEIQAFEYLIRETLNIAWWEGKPIVVQRDASDPDKIIKEIVKV